MIDNLINWLNEQYRVVITRNDEYILINIYIDINKRLNDITLHIEKHYTELNIEYMIPSLIMYENSMYTVDYDEYIEDIEFFSIKINI